LVPPELVFASDKTRRAIERARRLYGPAIEGAESWFVSPSGRALALSRTPGLGTGGELYGGVRDSVAWGCALALQTPRAPAACRSIPPAEPDAALAALSVLGPAYDGDLRVGARIYKAALASGLADPELADMIVFGRGGEAFGREAALAAAMPLLADADAAFGQPPLYDDAARRAALEYGRATGDAEAERRIVFEALGRLRRSEGALASVRLVAALRTPEDAVRLLTLADAAPGRVLALHDRLGEEMFALVEPERPPRTPERGALIAAIAFAGLALALALVIAVLASGAMRRRGGPPGPFERLDAAVTRLILGRNI
ncbi:MAG: hypothetical protein ACOC05_05030, partial [Oceanicaulis sp.]